MNNRAKDYCLILFQTGILFGTSYILLDTGETIYLSLSFRMEFRIGQLVCNRKKEAFFLPVGNSCWSLLRCSTVVTCNGIVIVHVLKSPEKLYLIQLAFIKIQTCPLPFPYNNLACLCCLSRL